jgi:hypothetical protein
MGSLWRGARDALRTGAIVVALAAVWGAAPAAAATTYVAGPSGSGEACSAAQPCSIAKAVSKAENGDSVMVLGGEYRLESPSALPIEGITISKAIDFGGAPGAVPLIETTYTQTIRVDPGAGASVHDLKLIGRGSFSLGSGSADRIYVAMGGEEKPIEPQGACELGRDTVLRDSVCWARDEGNPADAAGVKVEVSNEAPLTTVKLGNVTAIATDSGGDGLAAFAAYGPILMVEAKNVIARSEHGADVSSGSIGNASTSSTLVASHSNYSTISVAGSSNSITPPGTEGNQTAAPHFANPGAGDFHEAAGSPTIDGGIAGPLDSPFDLDGVARSLPGCIGGPAVPDIGAYEAAASAPCPVPPPAPTPRKPRKPRFRVVSVELHGSHGSVKVEVPSAGLLTLTGIGIKLVTRKISGPRVVSMPIKPWAITVAKLRKTGRAKIKLKVVFEPRVGGERQKSKTIVLKSR